MKSFDAIPKKPAKPGRMIFLFIDGFGIGCGNPDKNPICAANAPNIDYIMNNFNVMPTECSMGIPGLPQSATGQTAVFTGVNAAGVIGRHLNAQPTATLKKIIWENNLFKKLIGMGLKVANCNVYRQEYLEKMLNPKNRKHRPSVTSIMNLSSGIGFRTVDDYAEGRGVYHDITGQIIRDNGYNTAVISPAEAARRIYQISREYDFTLFEHFMTDVAGHMADMSMAVKEIELLDAFLGELVRLVDPYEDMVLITSDHGNIEDITVKTHTMNKIPTIVIGRMPENTGLKVESLTDIMPFVVGIFNEWRK